MDANNNLSLSIRSLRVVIDEGDPHKIEIAHWLVDEHVTHELSYLDPLAPLANALVGIEPIKDTPQLQIWAAIKDYVDQRQQGKGAYKVRNC